VVELKAVVVIPLNSDVVFRLQGSCSANQGKVILWYWQTWGGWEHWFM